jgi:hypothetical protein
VFVCARAHARMPRECATCFPSLHSTFLPPTFLSSFAPLLQVRNVAAAIECYRHAAEADPRDYRAWYGLGQTHELLSMFVYATYYFRRAVSFGYLGPPRTTDFGGVGLRAPYFIRMPTDLRVPLCCFR